LKSFNKLIKIGRENWFRS